jgi:hypothetical protein
MRRPITRRARRDRRPSPIESWILGRGAGAPIVRFVLVWGSVAVLWVGLVIAARRPLAPLPAALAWLPFPLDAFWQTIALFFSAPVLIHLIPIVGALWLGLRICAHYLADLFDLEDPSIASRYLWPALFGLDVLSYPRLHVATGDLEELDPASPLVAIGGPGYLKIHLGHAAVVEGLDGRPRVYGPARMRFLSGFERIRDVVDLRDQVGRAGVVRGVTRDGIEVHARDAQMVFRVFRGEGRSRSLEDPYPFDEASIRHLAYARPVEEGGRRRWADDLPERVRSEIRSFLEQSTIEEFLALRPQTGPGGPGASFEIPREALTARFHAPDHTQRLREAGLELDWVGVGTWELAGPGAEPETGVADTLISGWREKERLELYTSPEYLERQLARGFRDALGGALQEIVESWRGDSSAPEPQTASLLVLHRLHERLSRLRDQARSDPQVRLPVDFEAVLRHLASLSEPRWLGGAPG